MDESRPQTSVVRARETSSRHPSLAPSQAADYNLRVLWTLARYVEDEKGAESLQRLSAAGGVTPADFHGKNFWVSAESFEAILVAARALVADDDEFKRACIHRLKEAYGPLRYVLWATSVGAVFQQAAKQYALVCNCGSMIITEGRGTSAHCSVRSTVPYSRLNCLVRQAQSVALPTLWGLPPAHLREDKCIGRGDDSCELHYHWYAGRRWLPVIIGAVVAAILGYGLVRLGFTTIPTPVAMAMLGGVLGYLLEVRRTERVNDRTRQEVMEALRALAHEENEARHELLEMHQRQKGWTRLVEEEMGSRAEALQKLATGVKDLHEARASKLLGFSHDLRNPLQIIKMSAQYLESAPGVRSDSDAAESVRDIDQSVERMRHMLGDLVQLTKAQRDFVTMAPQRVETADLTDALRRRLRALVYGRDVRTTVFATREAPDHIEIDPLALDRIVDNLITNAAKYTERGSIVAELEGTPGFLVIKVSDTGRGIEPDAVDRIFQAGGSSLDSRRGDSFGVGLSVVVQLLDQMGGRLEVMSRPGSGTTFWVYLPLDPVERPSQVEGAGPESLPESTSPALSRVVSIRKLPA